MAAAPKQNILAIDVGGTHIKLRDERHEERLKFVSGPGMSPRHMVAEVRKLTSDWQYTEVAIGYPGPVQHGRPAAEPHNLGPGWVGFNFEKALGCPVRIANDAAMQALGSYEGGRMLFLGLGTGLGAALVLEGILQPLEIAHLPYRKGRTYEDYLGLRGLDRMGRSKWRRHVATVIDLFHRALETEYIVLGGGNAPLLKELPTHVRLGANTNAFIGGFRLWKGVPQS